MWSSNSFPLYFSKENQKSNSKRYMHPYAHCSIIYNSQDIKVTCVYKLMNTTWMDLDSIMLSKISQTEENEYCIISLLCGILKTTNKQM